MSTLDSKYGFINPDQRPGVPPYLHLLLKCSLMGEWSYQKSRSIAGCHMTLVKKSSRLRKHHLRLTFQSTLGFRNFILSYLLECYVGYQYVLCKNLCFSRVWFSPISICMARHGQVWYSINYIRVQIRGEELRRWFWQIQSEMHRVHNYKMQCMFLFFAATKWIKTSTTKSNASEVKKIVERRNC